MCHVIRIVTVTTAAEIMLYLAGNPGGGIAAFEWSGVTIVDYVSPGIVGTQGQYIITVAAWMSTSGNCLLYVNSIDGGHLLLPHQRSIMTESGWTWRGARRDGSGKRSSHWSERGTVARSLSGRVGYGHCERLGYLSRFPLIIFIWRVTSARDIGATTQRSGQAPPTAL